MATYDLTIGDDNQTGTSAGDLFEGWFSPGVTGGVDMLAGADGDDVFRLGVGSAGTINGGADSDTVEAWGQSLGATTFQNVEVLDAINGSVLASIAQLLPFGTITDSDSPGTQIFINLTGEGGKIDFTDRVTGAYSVCVQNYGVTSGYEVTGSVNGDGLHGSGFDDTLNGGAGGDVFYAGTGYGAGGVDLLDGGTGNDTFFVSGAAGSVNGGADSDKAVSDDLGSATYTSVETLDMLSGQVYGSVGQLASFATITDSDTPSAMLQFRLRGDGGVIDFSSHLSSAYSAYTYDYGVTSGYDVTGTANFDELHGSNFGDTLNGGDAADALFGSGGIDSLNGGNGDDTFYVSGIAGAVNGGADTDTAISDNLGTATYASVEFLNMLSGQVYGSIGQLASFATITDSDTPSAMLQFRLQGAGGAIDFSGRVSSSYSVYTYDYGVSSGYDVTGTANADELHGSGFDDTLEGGDGNDFLKGWGGRDTADYGSATAGVTVNIGAGSATGVGIGADTLIDMENAAGGSGADLLIGSGAGNALSGGGGADTLRGGLGADSLTGGGDVDRFDFNAVAEIGMALNARDVIADFQQGVDKIDLDGVDALSTLAGLQHFTWLGTAAHTGAGATLRYQQAGANTLVYGDVDANGSGDFAIQINGLFNLTAADFTNASITTIQGTNGNDVLAGAPGGKVMLGLNGNDTIAGAAGADTFWGGAGADSMTGGLGADHFKWGDSTHSGNAVGTRDIVADFQQGIDKLDLSAMDANSNVAGDQAFTFLGTAVHTGAGATLRYLQASGKTLVYGDVNGDAAADFTIQLTGLYTLTAADFVL